MTDILSVDTNTLTSAICAKIKADRPSCPFDQTRLRLAVRREKGLYTVIWSYGQVGFIPVTIDESRCAIKGGAVSVAIEKVAAALTDAFDHSLIVDGMSRRVLNVKPVFSRGRVGSPDDDDDDE
jgi:hypothetical protein